MFLFDQRIKGLNVKTQKVECQHIHSLYENGYNDFLPLTVYPKFNQDPEHERIRTIDPLFRYTQLKKIIKLENEAVFVCSLTYENNYGDTKHTLICDANNKIYTYNKGYFGVKNLGTQDVLMDETGRICKITHKSFYMHTADYYKCILKNGNNIVVSGLVTLPQ